MPGPITRRGRQEAAAGVEPASAVLQAAGRQSQAPCVLRSSLARPCPRWESNPVLDLRRVVCASVTPRGRSSIPNCCRVPHPGIEPGPAASKAAVRPPHPRGNSRVPSPGVEPGLRPSESRVPSVTRRGQERSRRPGSNRHEPAYKAGASPFGHVGGQQGRKDLNPVREFWRLAALPGAHPCKRPRPVRMPGHGC